MGPRRPADTSRSAASAQRAAFESLGPEGRLAAALEMSEEMRRTLEDGVRSRAPDAGDEWVRSEVFRLLYGAALARAVAARRAR
jgi:hypothetical protein